jgi:hypothetical protein
VTRPKLLLAPGENEDSSDWYVIQFEEGAYKASDRRIQEQRRIGYELGRTDERRAIVDLVHRHARGVADGLTLTRLINAIVGGEQDEESSG